MKNLCYTIIVITHTFGYWEESLRGLLINEESGGKKLGGE